MKQRLSVVIPCYNEEKIIFSTLEKVADFLERKDWEYEIIVVDDGSHDNSKLKIQNSKVKVKLLENGENRGKGFSVRRGVLEATGDLVLFMDSDNSTGIEEIEKLLPFTDKYDIVIGSRAKVESEIMEKQPWLRRFLSKMGNKLIKNILGLEIDDTQCGFKLFKKGILEIFHEQKLERWGFDFEILHLADLKNYKIKEVGVRWQNDRTSTVKLTDYLRTLGEVFLVKTMH